MAPALTVPRVEESRSRVGRQSPALPFVPLSPITLTPSLERNRVAEGIIGRIRARAARADCAAANLEG